MANNQAPDTPHGWLISAGTFVSGIVVALLPFLSRRYSARSREMRAEQELGIEMMKTASGGRDAEITRLWSRCDALEKENKLLRDEYEKEILKLQEQLFEAKVQIKELEFKLRALSHTPPSSP